MDPERPNDPGNAHSTLESDEARDARTGDAPSTLRMPPPPAPAGVRKARSAGPLGLPRWAMAVGALSVTGSIATGYVLGGRASTQAAKGHAWSGTVAKVVRAGGEAPTLAARGSKGEEMTLTAGAKISAGMELRTDARSRARIELDDGTVLALDRQTTIRFEASPRTIRVSEGVVMADVAHVEGASPAKMITPSGVVDVLGTKFALTTTADRTSVEVLRGTVELRDAAFAKDRITVAAGQEGIAARNAKLEIAPVQGLAQRLAFGERLGFGGHNEDTDLPVGGLGELRAKKPGKTDEKDRAVRLASHRVKVRVAGSVARTEIDEIFTNDADEELEGIYRFPLPPGAQIERLALEVDGKLMDGSFVDKSKGAAIWRGVIQNAAPKAPKPKEEIFWVPGPWRDPALLEWKRGGRFELRIFPIPKRGSRRIVIAYTENLAPVAGVRRYTYPLPQSTSSDLKIGAFDLDVQVLGSDPKQGVRARGYELRRGTSEGGGGGERFTMSERDFVPTGDLTVEYALTDRASDVSAWAFTANEDAVAPPGVVLAATSPSAPPTKGGFQNYASLALRPKFASWGESKPRDVVIVVDSGRSMFGERFQRARRLAVQVAQELDRRDRVTVLACDVTCRETPAGLANAGGQTAKTIAEFLGAVEPDGATDLVGALRRASSRREASRDLRIVLVTDGVVGAGYRTPERIERETRDFLSDARTSLVAVPIGADADTRLLEGVARASGGVVVPYAPGQTLEGTAVDVLTASYGVSLRDVEVTLPEGMSDMAPRVLPSIRPGGELVVSAKLLRESVKGDVVLRGRVAGQPFEARYPLDLKATTANGNAFVPRLFAAARIADLEDKARNDGERAEILTLSQRYSVPSRLTSLLVLESEAMFRAFGIDRSSVAATWTGESLAEGTEVATAPNADVGAGPGGSFDELAKKDDKASTGAASPMEEGLGIGGSAGPSQGFGTAGRAAASQARPSKPAGESAPAPATMAAPSAASPKAMADAFDTPDDRKDVERDSPSPRKSVRRPAATPPQSLSSSAANECRCRAGDSNCTCLRGQTFMKRVWVRHATIAQSAAPPVTQSKLTVARAALQSAPDERNKHRDFARLLSSNGDLDELGEVLARWSGRDPMDADVIAMRADLAARSGDRPRALRVLSGVAAGGQADVNVLEALAQSHERAGENEGACAFRVSVAETRMLDLKGTLADVDSERVARAVTCEERSGRASSGGRAWFEGWKDSSVLERALSKVRAESPREQLRGDVVVEATWDPSTSADVDLAVVDSNGQRLSWVTRSKSVRVQDPTSRSREVLAVSTTGTGPFTIELTRASGSNPVRVQLSVRALGERSTFPVILNGPVSRVARVQVRVDEEFVATNMPPDTNPLTPWRR